MHNCRSEEVEDVEHLLLRAGMAEEGEKLVDWQSMEDDERVVAVLVMDVGVMASVEVLRGCGRCAL